MEDRNRLASFTGGFYFILLFMSTLASQEKRNVVLLALFELHSTKGPRVNIYELEKRCGLERIEFYNIIRELGRTRRGWLTKSNEIVFITPEGIDKAEELRRMEIAKLERIILQKFYDLGGANHMEWVLLDTLTKELNMKFSDIQPILNDLEDRGLLTGNGEAMWLTPAGVGEVQNPSSNRTGGFNYFETHINNVQGGVAVGDGITQYISVNNNQFNDAINKLLLGVEDSTELSQVKKMTLAADIRTIQQLGEMEKTPDVMEAANSKIESVNSILSSTADMVSLGMVVIPIIRACFGI